LAGIQIILINVDVPHDELELRQNKLDPLIEAVHSRQIKKKEFNHRS